MPEKESTCDLPSRDILFDSSASTIPDYEYEHSYETTNELNFKNSKNYRVS